MDRRARCALIAAVLTCAVALAPRTADTASDDPRETYNQWVAKYAARSLDGSILVITLIDDAPRKSTVLSQGPAGTYTFTVKHDGQIWWQSSGPFESRGGNGNPVALQSLKRLKELLSQMPADAGSLPPPERRIMLQTSNATRVYDRAQFAENVAEILRLSGCRIGSWRPAFEAQNEVDARVFGLLSLCPDGKRLLCGTQLLALPTFETLGDLEINEGYSEMAFSPDGLEVALSRFNCQIVDISTGKLVRELSEPTNGRHHPNLEDPHFTPDGRVLVLRASDSGLRFFDTKTWESIRPIPEIPADAIQWKSSKSWLHAVMRTEPGVVWLWDAKSKSPKQLDVAASLLDVAFSPDELQVAVVTCDKNGYSNPRLRIFQTSTGQLVHELRVGEIGCDRLRLPLWTPDGRYVLAVTKPDSFFSNENVSLWDATTGRQRADFVGCIGISGFVLLPTGDQLIAGSNGTLHIWNFKTATKKIGELEELLSPSPVP